LQGAVVHLIDAEIAVAGGAAGHRGRRLLFLLLGLYKRLDAIGAARELGVGCRGTE
jgi:hypothetical protein